MPDTVPYRELKYRTQSATEARLQALEDLLAGTEPEPDPPPPDPEPES